MGYMKSTRWWMESSSLYFVINIVGIYCIKSMYALKEAFCENNVVRPIISANSFAYQTSIKDGFAIRQASNKGMGVFATVAISKGETLGEYTGEILTRRDVEARYWNLQKQNKHDRKWKNSRKRRNQGITGDYLFDLGNDSFIDGEDADVSSWCRFCNHATDPNDYSSNNDKESEEGDDELLTFGDCNVETRIRLSWDEEENQVRRLFLVALRDIEPLEEICFDYGGEYW